MEKLSINNRRYLGSKYKLINFIKSVVEEECGNFSSFLDVFGGTGVVGFNFNNPNTSVIVNDILKSNYISYLAWFGKDGIDKEKIVKLIEQYNNCEVESDNYFSENFANTYYSKENTMKIGYIREDIEEQFSKGELTEREHAVLITSLIYAMDKIANTVGHYDAYRKTGDLNRKLEMRMLDLPGFEVNENNKIFSIDANELVRTVKADVVYIDPPYNSRQYCDAYHLLENVATWEKPKVEGVAKKMNRSHIKSKYCTVSALQTFRDLISNIDSKYIIVSYNNMGNKGAGRSQAKLHDYEIEEILSEVGKVNIHEIEYNQFTTGKTNIDNHKERLFVCHVGDMSHKEKLTSVEQIGHVKSPLNYTGGKYKLLDQIVDKFPKEIDTFIDLFTGGANVGVNVTANKIICNDKQEEVIKILNLFDKYSEYEIIDTIETLINRYNLSNSFVNGYKYYDCDSNSGLVKYNKERYYKMREDYNNMAESETKDFYLLLLIIYSFNNQLRFNGSGDYNMPVGKRDFNNSIRKNMKNFIRKIKSQHIEFISNDFRKIKLDDYENPFIYCDPPYYLGTAAYNENGGWSESDELSLLDYLYNADAKGYKFALSNVIEHKGMKHHKLIDWAMENHYSINYLNFNYNNSNYQSKNKINKTVEVLITNY